MAACRGYFYRHFWNHPAFSLFMDKQKPLHLPLFRRKRIHLGTHEAFLFSRTDVRHCAERFSTSGIQKLLVDKVHRHPYGTSSYPHPFLHVKRSVW